MGTYNQVPEQHVRTSTYKVAHTTQVPHTGYTTSYRTEEVPYAKKAGYLRRLAEASTDTDAAQASLTKKGTLKYGEKVVSTYTTKTPYTVQVPHTYTTKVPHTTTYYKTKTNYKYVAKPYTVVTHLVCTPSTHVEYRCPACHGGDNSYAGVADSFGAWLSPPKPAKPLTCTTTCTTLPLRPLPWVSVTTRRVNTPTGNPLTCPPSLSTKPLVLRPPAAPSQAPELV